MTTAVAAAAAPNRALIGIACMLIASSLFPVMNGLVQILSERYSTEQVVWARAASHLMFILGLFAPRFGVAALLRTVTLKWQIIRSGVHLASMLCFFTGVKYLPLAKAASISFTTPFFVALLAWPMLGERITPRRLMAIMVAFFGVLIVIRPGTEVFQWASLFMLGSAICYALYQILTRRIASVETPETSAIYSSIVGAFGLMFVLPFVWKTPETLRDVAYFCSLGVLGALGHYCVARALHYAPANIVTPFQYMQLLGSVVVGYLFFGNFPDVLGWIGAAIIVGAGLYIGWSQRKAG